MCHVPLPPGGRCARMRFTRATAARRRSSTARAGMGRGVGSGGRASRSLARLAASAAACRQVGEHQRCARRVGLYFAPHLLQLRHRMRPNYQRGGQVKSPRLTTMMRCDHKAYYATLAYSGQKRAINGAALTP